MPSPPALSNLEDTFGKIDVYLFDQLLKGRIVEGMKILDAGCGSGRNMQYLMQAGVTVYGVDTAAVAIQEVRGLAQRVAPKIPAENFTVADLAQLPYSDKYFNVVVCSAVLHFSNDEQHFNCMVQDMWRVLNTGGILFCRLSTTIGMSGKLQQVQARHYQMPHGPAWFLADEDLIRTITASLGAVWLEPLKTVLVEQERSMSTWVLQKP